MGGYFGSGLFRKHSAKRCKGHIKTPGGFRKVVKTHSLPLNLIINFNPLPRLVVCAQSINPGPQQAKKSPPSLIKGTRNQK